MAKAKKKKVAKKPPAEKKPKASRRAASKSPGGVGHNMPPDEYKAALETAISEIMEIKTAAEKDAMGWKTDLGISYEKHAEKMGIRQSVLKDEANRAWSRAKQIEKEKAYDPIERDQRLAIRAAMDGSDQTWKGTPFGDLFSGVLADPEDGADEDADAEAGEEGETEGD